MEKETASMLIKSIAEAIKKDPGQFHFTLKISGMNVRASGGSTGMIVSATGGGPGSQTSGLHISMDNHNIEIAKQNANAVQLQQMTQIYNTLNEIAEKLSLENKGVIKNLYDSLKNTWVPGVVTSIVGNILSLVLGINT